MGKGGETFWETAIYRRALQHWALSARRARTARLGVLRRQTTRARLLRIHLDRLIQTAEERLALPAIGARGFAKPHNADWAWRPDLWRGPAPTQGMSPVPNKSRLGDELTLFHDCTLSEITLRQVRNTRQEDLAPYGLRLEVFRFDGTFLSAVVDLPEAAAGGLGRGHILRLTSIIEAEIPTRAFARLNIRHGPNTEQILRELDMQNRQVEVEFDLAYSDLDDSRIGKLWVDFIFEQPQMNQITLRDLTFSRRPRAQL